MELKQRNPAVRPAENPQLRNRFRKRERLCGQQTIDNLYKNGQSMLHYPLRCMILTTVNPIPQPTSAASQRITITPASSIRVLISVPKRNHKRAVSRNLLKRRMREAYRLNKHQLEEHISAINLQLAHEGQYLKLDMALAFVSREVLDYHTIENAVKRTIKEIIDRTTTSAD